MNREGAKNFATAVGGTVTGAATLLVREGQNIAERVHTSPEQVGATTMWVLVIGVVGGLIGRGVYSRFAHK